jgi:hypothetical protein
LLFGALGMTAYQESVIADSTRPRVEAARLVFHGLSRSGTNAVSSAKLVSVPHKGNFSLAVQFTSISEYSSYQARILSKSGSVEYSLPLPGTRFEEGCTVAVPARALKPGRHSIVVEGSNASGVEEPIAGGDFELQFID